MAQRALAAAIAALNSPAGEPCRAYLAGRGIQSKAWQAWRLGYDSARFDPIQERRRPAIVLPWIGPQGLTGLKYRFLDSQSHHDRFSQMRGSQQILFGGHLLTPQHDTLILCEGELNAVSIWQALRAQDTAAVDVVSFGSQSAATSEAVLAVARHYQRVILWADETAPVRACLDALGARAFGLKSPTTGDDPPIKLDANALLQRGMLGELLRRALSRFQIVTQANGPESVVQATSAHESATLPQPEHDTSSPAATSAPHVESKVTAPPAPRVGETVRIPLDHLVEYLAEHRLRIVGGDPAQDRQPWRPLLYLADRAGADPVED